MTRHRVCAASEIPDGGRLAVDIAGRTIVLFNVAGRFYALADRCPHQGGPLSKGDQIGELTSAAPGRHDYCRRNMTIRCPWHHWEFDIETGRSRIDPARLRVRSYETALGDEAADVSEDVPAATTFPTEERGGDLYVIL